MDAEANDGHVGDNPFKVSLSDIHSVSLLMLLLYLLQRPQVQAVGRSKSVRVRLNAVLLQHHTLFIKCMPLACPTPLADHADHMFTGLVTATSVNDPTKSTRHLYFCH